LDNTFAGGFKNTGAPLSYLVLSLFAAAGFALPAETESAPIKGAVLSANDWLQIVLLSEDQMLRLSTACLCYQRGGDVLTRLRPKQSFSGQRGDLLLVLDWSTHPG